MTMMRRFLCGFLSLLFLSRATSSDDLVCPAGQTLVEVYYKFEITVDSDANFCTKSEKARISRTLERLLESIVGRLGVRSRRLLSIEAEICPVSQNGRRSLMTPSVPLSTPLFVAPPSVPLSTPLSLVENNNGTTLDNPHYLGTTNNSNNKTGMQGLQLLMMTPQSDNQKWKKNNTDSQMLMFSVQRELQRRQFVYIGGMRCTYCHLDDQDSRLLIIALQQSNNARSLAKSCRQRSKYLFHGPKNQRSANTWNNGKFLNNHGGIKNLLGPYKRRQIVSRFFSVPKWADMVEISFQIHQIGPYKWNPSSSDGVIITINGAKQVVRQPINPTERNGNLFQTGRNNKFTTAIKYRYSSSGQLKDTTVHLKLERSAFETRTRSFSLSLEFKAKGKVKKAAYGNIKIVAKDTCTSFGEETLLEKGKPKSLDDMEFEAEMETKLSRRLTSRFRGIVERNNDHCLHDANPLVYVNLYSVNSWEEAQPDC